MPDRDVITVRYRPEWGIWRANIPGPARRGAAESPSLPVLLGWVHAIGQAQGMRVEVWDESIPPGGWVCGWPVADHPGGYCGMPVEDVPCTVHWPLHEEDSAGLAALFAESAAAGRHPLGRQGMPWLPLFLLPLVALALLFALGWWLL